MKFAISICRSFYWHGAPNVSHQSAF